MFHVSLLLFYCCVAYDYELWTCAILRAIFQCSCNIDAGKSTVNIQLEYKTWIQILRLSIIQCAVKTSLVLKTVYISLCLDRSYRLQNIFLLKLVFTLQIWDHFFLNFNSVLCTMYQYNPIHCTVNSRFGKLKRDTSVIR